MSRLFRAAILLAFLASCGGGNFSAPRNLDNACAIVDERPQYFRAMQDTEQKWGVPVPVLMAIIHQDHSDGAAIVGLWLFASVGWHVG
jgi:hypothetical protein